MKVLFVNPSRAGQGNVPLNIPLLITIVKKHNHKVALFDMSDFEIFNNKSYEDMFFKKAPFDVKQIIADRSVFYKRDFDTNTAYKLKESDYHLCFEESLNAFTPDIIAVSCLSIDFRFACDFLSPFKKKFKIPVIFGGIHARLLPEETLSSDVCDFVCTGEGENSFAEFLYAFERNKPLKKVGGIWFKKNGRITKNPFMELTNLNNLPIPDFDCFDPLNFYRPFDGNRYKMLNYELSRGCLFNCSYCVNVVLKNTHKGSVKYHRIKQIERSIEELKILISKYNFNFIRFWDEDFTSTNISYLEDYAKIYLKEINLPFLIYARVDTVTEDKVKILKEMGCRTFAMGIESGNEFIRTRVLNRKMSNKTLIEKFKLVKSYGIRVSAYNIIGLPYETRERIFETIELNRVINPDSFSVTLLEPYRGTPIREICHSEGLVVNYEVTNYDSLHFIPKGMTHDELNGLFRTFAFYVRFPKERYAEIRLSERDEKSYKKLKEELSIMK